MGRKTHKVTPTSRLTSTDKALRHARKALKEDGMTGSISTICKERTDTGWSFVLRDKMKGKSPEFWRVLVAKDTGTITAKGPF